MTISELAKHYLRFWTRTPEGMQLADNAPSKLWKFVLGLSSTTDRLMVYAALKAVAEGRGVDLPDTPIMLKWFANHPDSIGRFDEIIQAKKPPKSFAELVERSYRSELFSVVDRVHDFLTKIVTI